MMVMSTPWARRYVGGGVRLGDGSGSVLLHSFVKKARRLPAVDNRLGLVPGRRPRHTLVSRCAASASSPSPEEDSGSKTQASPGIASAGGTVSTLQPQLYSNLRRLVAAASLLVVALAAGYCQQGRRGEAGEAAAPSYSLSQTTTYNIQRLFSAPILVKLLTVMMLAVPVVGLLGSLYARVKGIALPEGLRRCYTVLNDCPGADMAGEEELGPFLVLNLTFLVGVLAYAVLFGVIVEEIQCAVDNFRRGNSSVCLSRHTVVLGWNEFTLPLLRQLSVAKRERALAEPVVILGTPGREEMESELEARLGAVDMDVQVRSGTPTSMADLERVGANRASTVVLLDSGGEGHQDQKVAAVLGLHALTSGSSFRQTMVVQDNDTVDSQATYQTQLRHIVQGDNVAQTAQASAATGARADSVHREVLVFVKDVLDDSVLAAQCALQPGMGAVMQEILTQGTASSEIYIKEFPELAGRSWGQVSRMFSNAALIGITEAAQGTAQSRINPPASTILKPGQRLVGLAQNAEEFQLSPWEAEPFDDATARAVAAGTDRMSSPKNVMVLHLGPASISSLDRLAEQSPPGSRITVVAEQKPDGFFTKRHGCRFRWHQGNPGCMRTLADAELCCADAIILQGLHNLPPERADARVASTLLQLADVWAKAHPAGRRLHIVAPVNSPSAAQLITPILAANQHITVSVLDRCQLRSGILAQVAAQPELGSVLTELLGTSEGQELVVARCNRWVLATQPDAGYDWKIICEAARLEGRLAVGYIRGSTGEVVLAPPAKQPVRLCDSDRMVFVADVF